MSSSSLPACAFCTFINPPESKICSICKKSLHLPALPAIDSSKVKVCPGCSLFNETFYDKCKICGTELESDCASWEESRESTSGTELASGSTSGTELASGYKSGTELASRYTSGPELASRYTSGPELTSGSTSGAELASGYVSGRGATASANVCSLCSTNLPGDTLIKICHTCTYHNPAETTKCLICETKFGSKQKAVLSKVCSFCNHDNFAGIECDDGYFENPIQNADSVMCDKPPQDSIESKDDDPSDNRIGETLPKTDPARVVEELMDTEEDEFSIETMSLDFSGVSMGNSSIRNIPSAVQANAIASKAVHKKVPKNEDCFEMLETAPRTHKYFDMKSASNSPKFMRAVSSNIEILKTSAPPGVWIKCFEDRMDLLSFMIEGPQNTPYENGLFIFDIHLSPEFPFRPPSAHYISFWAYRLNPNLYAEGKVCVSLLGTWYAEREEEQWRPTSTLLQLIVSIQGLILVEQPYFNEPGYASQFGTPEGNRQSALYNEGVTIGMIDSTTALITDPPLTFKKEIFFHFARCGATMYERLKTAIRKMESPPPLRQLESLRWAIDNNVYDNVKRNKCVKS